jgi:hypothetical protein
MKKAKLEFEFIKSKGQWPICIAKTKNRTFICLEYFPHQESYTIFCQDFLRAFLHGYSYPKQWQEVTEDACVKEGFHAKCKEVARGLLLMKDLPF